MKKIKKISLMLVVILILSVFVGCSQKLDIRPEIQEELESYIKTYKEARDNNDTVTGEEIKHMTSMLENRTDLTSDEKSAIEKVRSLCRKYVLVEYNIVVMGDIIKSAKALEQFDKEYEEISKYIK